MQLTLPRKTLHEALSIVARASTVKSTLPITSHILFRPDPAKDTLTLTACNLSLWLEETVPVKMQFAEGEDPFAHPEEIAFTCSAALLSQLVAKLPEKDVILSREAPSAEVGLLCGPVKTTLRSLPADQFPVWPQMEGDSACADVAPVTLGRLLSLTKFAASTDEKSPVICCVHLGMDAETGTFFAEASDRRRIARAIATPTGGVSASGDALLPGEAVAEVLRLSEQQEKRVPNATPPPPIHVAFSAGGEHADFRFASMRLTAALVQGNFPNVTRIMPDLDKNADRALFDREALRGAIARAALYADNQIHYVEINTALGGLEQGSCARLTVENSDQGGFEETIECAVTGDGFLTAFSHRQLLPMLDALPAQGIRVQQANGAVPALITPGGEGVWEDVEYRYVCAPLHLRTPADTEGGGSDG